jgi:hypothetical protein
MAQQMNVAAAFAEAEKAAKTIVAEIRVVMSADGNVVAQCRVPNRLMMLGMLEQAKADLNAKLLEEMKKAAEGPRIETPNGGGLLVAG